MFTLHVKPITGKPFSQRLTTNSVVVGRSRCSDLVLSDEAISRRHARLFLKGSAWYVEDLNSRNGTLVDEVPVLEPMPLEEHILVNLSGNTLYISSHSETPQKVPTVGPPQEASEIKTPQEVARVTPFTEGTVLRSVSEILSDSRSQIDTEADEQSLRLIASRLALLNDVHDALCKPITVKELLEHVLGKIFVHLGPEDACVYLKAEKGNLESAARRTIEGFSGKSLQSQTLVREVAEGGLAALVYDVTTDDRFSTSDSMVNAGIRSLVAAPLLDDQGSLGMIVLASRMAVRSFSEDDMALLVSLASLATLRIRNLKLQEEASNALRNDNILLEQKVAERTAALEQRNEELRTKNEAILRQQHQMIIQEKMASVGTLAAGMAHLIKNPLNFVKNLSEVSKEMLEELSSLLQNNKKHLGEELFKAFFDSLSDLHTNVHIVHSHGVRADQIVVSMMEYAREPSKGDRRLIDINGLVEKYSQLTLLGAIAGRNIPIVLNHDHAPNVGQVWVFAGDLSRVIIGIVNNAVEAVLEHKDNVGKEFEGIIETKTRIVDNMLEISISDNGMGIPEECQHNLFNPFFTTKHDDAHIGLGLSISYDIITQRHQGSLKVSSEAGTFTRFIIQLPMAVGPSTGP